MQTLEKWRRHLHCGLKIRHGPLPWKENEWQRRKGESEGLKESRRRDVASFQIAVVLRQVDDGAQAASEH